jgi:PilZ domain
MPKASSRVFSDRRRARRPAASDRRHHSRVKLDVLVNRFLNGHPYMCRMTDISRTGARLVPILEPKVREAPRFVGLQFQLPGRDEILTASGELISEGEPSRAVGVRFSNLPPDSAWAIEAFLSAP